MSEQSRRTPYDDDYATCVETRAELLVYPADLSPGEVSERLGLEPTQSAKAGEQITNRLGRVRTVHNSLWILSSEGAVSSKDVRRHLDWLLARLEPRGPAIAALQLVPGVTMGIDCLWESRSGEGGPTLWPAQMRLLATLDLECSFNVVFYPSD